MATLGEKIRILRKKSGLSQEDLGFEINVSRQTISKWENNEMQPTTDNVISVCDFFGVDVEKFLYGEILNKAEQIEFTSANTDLSLTINDNIDSVICDTDKNIKPKNKLSALNIIAILFLTFVFVISLIFGIIFIILYLQPQEGFVSASHVNISWEGIVCFCIAILALIFLIGLLIYIFKYKKNKM